MNASDATMSLVDTSDAAAASTPPSDAGARERMTQLFHATYADLVRYVRARTHAAHVEDVVSETYLIAWRRLDALPQDPSQARAWLFVTARNVLLNAGRSAARHTHLELNLQLAAADLPQDQVTARLDLAAALRSLSAADQETLALTVVDQLEPAEAAAVLGIGANAYSARLSRARKRLREALTDRDGGRR